MSFSRHFAGKEDPALDFVRRDGDRINALLRSRPAGEPPLLACRRAVREWPADPDDPARHVRPRMRRLLVLAGSEPDLFAAYQRIRVDAQELIAFRLSDRAFFVVGSYHLVRRRLHRRLTSGSASGGKRERRRRSGGSRGSAARSHGHDRREFPAPPRR